jgi:hypothetical protein
MAKKIILSLILACAALLTACGSKTATVGTPSPSTSTKQLDPQGNWFFTLTSSNTSLSANSGNVLTWGEELFELSAPTVTSNSGLGWTGSWGGYPTPPAYTMQVAGAVSGTATMNFTATDTNSGGTIALTGTIADSQTSISGTFTVTSNPSNFLNPNFGDSGTWTAILLAPVTGSYTGTLTSNGNTISVAMSLTEDTSQTDKNMGQVTGTITISGSPCFNSSTPLTIASYADGGTSNHVGEWLQISTVPDANGQSVGIITNPDGVDPISAAITLPSGALGNYAGLTITGGPCANGGVVGGGYSGTLTK